MVYIFSQKLDVVMMCPDGKIHPTTTVSSFGSEIQQQPNGCEPCHSLEATSPLGLPGLAGRLISGPRADIITKVYKIYIQRQLNCMLKCSCACDQQSAGVAVDIF